eukprot:gene13409-17981_t
MIDIRLLLNLPDSLLTELWVNWVTLKELSLLDIALCNHNYRKITWQTISSASSTSPIYGAKSVYLSYSYWRWLINRQICVRNLVVTNFWALSYLSSLLIKGEGFSSDFENEFSKKLSNFTVAFEEKEVLDGSVGDKLSLNILSIFKNLEIFTCKDCPIMSDELLMEISKYLTKLKSFSLISSFADISDESLANMLSTNESSLSKLIVNGDINTKITGRIFSPMLLSNLEELDLSGCVNISEKDYCSISLSLKNLKILSISGNEEHAIIDDQLLKSMMQKLPNLTSLSVNRGNFNGEFHPKLPSSLTSLSLTDAENVTYRGLRKLLSNDLSNLTLLHISRNDHGIDGTAFSGLLPQSLAELVIDSCEEILDEDLISIFSDNNLSNLVTLKVT